MEIHNGERTLYVDVDGGPGAPPVLLLHGITSSGRTWEWLVPDLVERHRVIRLDFRGHGRSSRAPGHYGRDAYVSDAAAVCRQVAGVPSIVIGHSLGGATALALAQQHGDLVRALVVEDPPLGGGSRVLDGNTLRDGFAQMRESVPRLQASGIPLTKLAEVLSGAPSPVGTPFGELLHRDAIDAMAAAMLELDVSVLDLALGTTPLPDFDPTLPADIPTLVITADPTSPDAVARPAGIDQLVAASPHVQVQVMEGASHLIHDELANRDRFRNFVMAFVGQLDANGTS